MWIAVLALLPACALAQNWWGSVNLTSLHGHTKKPMNQRNFGLGIEYHRSDELIFLAGAYHNSHRRTSVYALAGWTPLRWGHARFGFTGGLVNGYPNHNDGKVIPVATGLVRIEGERWGANIILIPPALKNTPLTLGFQVKYRFY